MALRSFVHACVVSLLVYVTFFTEAHGAHQVSFRTPVGYRKGDAARGLYKLKKYLHYLGYMPGQKLGKKSHMFDDQLESAVTAYQRFHGLNLTGMLDGQTMQEMSKPRCGVPDNMVGSASNQSGQFHTHFRFFPGVPKWPDSMKHLTFGFSPRDKDNYSFRYAAGRAFNTWAASSKFTFEETEDYKAANFKLGLYFWNHKDGLPFDGRGGILGHGFPPTKWWVHLDGSEKWSINPEADYADMESVLLHEIGHALGLAHTTRPEAVMYPAFKIGTTNRALAQDDINAIQFLYRD